MSNFCWTILLGNSLDHHLNRQHLNRLLVTTDSKTCLSRASLKAEHGCWTKAPKSHCLRYWLASATPCLDPSQPCAGQSCSSLHYLGSFLLGGRGTQLAQISVSGVMGSWLSFHSRLSHRCCWSPCSGFADLAPSYPSLQYRHQRQRHWDFGCCCHISCCLLCRLYQQPLLAGTYESLLSWIDRAFHGHLYCDRCRRCGSHKDHLLRRPQPRCQNQPWDHFHLGSIHLPLKDGQTRPDLGLNDHHLLSCGHLYRKERRHHRHCNHL